MSIARKQRKSGIEKDCEVSSQPLGNSGTFRYQCQLWIQEESPPPLDVVGASVHFVEDIWLPENSRIWSEWWCSH